MSPFSSLAREYSKALKKYTLTGYATLNRKIFTQIYAQIRSTALSERVIRAGWKRTGIHPLNKQKILDLSEIRNFERTTPEYQPPAVPQGPQGIYTTPKKFKDICATISKIEAASSPTTRRVVEKLGHAALHEYTGAQALASELKQLREHSTNDTRNKRSKRLHKDENQRSWDFEQVKQSREGIAGQSRAAQPAQDQNSTPQA